jgi:hypothetical protein
LALQWSTATVLSGMATAIYATGGVCWIVALAFRLPVVPWAAERAAAGHVPDGFAAYDRWAGALYVVHMLTAYVIRHSYPMPQFRAPAGDVTMRGSLCLRHRTGIGLPSSICRRLLCRGLPCSAGRARQPECETKVRLDARLP